MWQRSTRLTILVALLVAGTCLVFGLILAGGNVLKIWSRGASPADIADCLNEKTPIPRSMAVMVCGRALTLADLDYRTHAQLLVRRGQLQNLMKKPDDALTDLDAAQQIDPYAPGLQRERAVSFLALHKIRKANDAITLALNTNQRDAEAYYLRGMITADMSGEASATASAIADFGRSLALNPDNPVVYRMRAAAYIASGDKRSSLPDLEKLYQLTPDDTWASRNLCAVQAIIGTPDKALAVCAQAAKQSGNAGEARGNIAFALLRLGRYQEAIAAWNDALSSADDFPPFLFCRGYTEERAGAMTEAQRDYQQARGLDADIDRKMARRGIVPGHKDIYATD